MQDSDEIDATVDRFIEDNVSPEREAAYAAPKLTTSPADRGLRREQPQFMIQTINPTVGSRQTVFGNVIPDFDDVGRGKRPARHERHLGFHWPAGPSGATLPLDRLGIPGLARPAILPLADFTSKLRQLRLAEAVLLLKQPQRLAHDFAGRRVPAGRNPRSDKLLQLGTQADIHAHRNGYLSLTLVSTETIRKWQRWTCCGARGNRQRLVMRSAQEVLGPARSLALGQRAAWPWATAACRTRVRTAWTVEGHSTGANVGRIEGSTRLSLEGEETNLSVAVRFR